MDKKVALVGMGCGAYTVTAEGMIAIEKADLICGSKRMLELLPDTDARLIEEYRTSALSEILPDAPEENIVVMYSGDVSLYSGAGELFSILRERGIDVYMIPGVSVVSYFAARTGKALENVNVVSCHGRRFDLSTELKKCQPLFVYTSNRDDVMRICGQLCDMGKGSYTVMVGEHLGYDDERITSYMADQLGDVEIDQLNVMYIEEA